METLSICPVCSKSAFKPFITCKDYTVSSKSFDIQSCDTCGFLFTNPRPSKDEIGTYYQSVDYISHSNSSKGLFNKAYQLIRGRAIKQKLELIQSFFPSKHSLRLLDVGCGTGEFLNGAKKAGWEVAGVEPSPDAANQAKNNYSLPVYEEAWLENTAEKFDVITLWHVLEHVHDLDVRLKQLNRLLDDKGLLVIAVPNYTSADANEFDACWAAWDVPRHLYHFSPESMKKLLGNYGFKHVGSKPMVFDAYYVSLLSTGYAQGKKSLLNGFLSGFKSNLAAKGNAEKYSSVIYLFKKQDG
ncbi:MAG: class I SAM-dependent methyltransferase [Bacteroidota bacterium]